LVLFDGQERVLFENLLREVWFDAVLAEMRLTLRAPVGGVGSIGREYYCRSCHMIGCAACIITGHGGDGHDTGLLEEMGGPLRIALQQCGGPLGTRCKVLRAGWTLSGHARYVGRQQSVGAGGRRTGHDGGPERAE
jgi:hypothetical protein